MDPDCDFCKIVNPHMVNYPIISFPIAQSANGDYIAFLEIRPFAEGHTIITTTKHYKSSMDIPNNGSFFDFVKQVGNHLIRVKQRYWNQTCDIQLIMFNDRISHAHAHLIPIPLSNTKFFRKSYFEFQNQAQKPIIKVDLGMRLRDRYNLNWRDKTPQWRAA